MRFLSALDPMKRYLMLLSRGLISLAKPNYKFPGLNNWTNQMRNETVQTIKTVHEQMLSHPLTSIELNVTKLRLFLWPVNPKH